MGNWVGNGKKSDEVKLLAKNYNDQPEEKQKEIAKEIAKNKDETTAFKSIVKFAQFEGSESGSHSLNGPDKSMAIKSIILPEAKPNPKTKEDLIHNIHEYLKVWHVKGSGPPTDTLKQDLKLEMEHADAFDSTIQTEMFDKIWANIVRGKKYKAHQELFDEYDMDGQNGYVPYVPEIGHQHHGYYHQPHQYLYGGDTTYQLVYIIPILLVGICLLGLVCCICVTVGGAIVYNVAKKPQKKKANGYAKLSRDRNRLDQYDEEV